MANHEVVRTNATVSMGTLNLDRQAYFFSVEWSSRL